MRGQAEWFDELATMAARVSVELDEIEQMPLGPAMMSRLVALCSAPLGSTGGVRATALWMRLIAHCQAQSMISSCEATVAGDLAGIVTTRHEADEIIGVELAAMTHQTDYAATSQVRLANQVGDQLPLSWVALNRGELSLDHVKRLAQATTHCTPRVAKAVDEQLIPLAIKGGWTPNRLEKEADEAIVAIDPAGAAERAKKAKQHADVRSFRGRDETATLEANGDALTVQLMMDTIDAMAAQLSAENGLLPIGVRRFDVLASLVLGDAQVQRPNVEGLVNIDFTTWLGLDDKPGELVGYGPISAGTARDLLMDAAVRRMITDPLTGELLDVSPNTYRPSASQRRFVEARDHRCTFPGCHRPAINCDLDHWITFISGGRTIIKNLHALCRRHHNLKTHNLWQVAINPDRSETWTSALGFTYTTAPETYRRLDLVPIAEPEAEEIPEEVANRIPDHDPNPPPGEDDPLPEPPTLTLEEYLTASDEFERYAFIAANNFYDQWRNLGLVS